MKKVAILGVLIFLPMLIEVVRAAQNERVQRARGGVEPQDDVYGLMRVAYPAAFLAMLVEAALRGLSLHGLFVAGVLVFGAGKLIKWWAIVSLGSCWTFRVIVVPGDTAVTSGLYRYVRHPNYLGVVGELVGVAMMARAFVTGPVAIVGFGLLILKRIAVEDRALDQARTRIPDAILRAR